MTICVIGLGKIGLPLAVQIAGRGQPVIGVDIDAGVVADVSAGREPFPGELELADRLGAVVTSGRLTATTDTAAAVGVSNVVVVVVPLVVAEDLTPDFAALDAATGAIGPSLRPGTLVSYETTLPVHTTRHRFTPMLEAGSGLTVGTDLFVCHSPERVSSGRIFGDLRRYPKLVGAVDAESARRAVAFYEAVLEFDDRPDLDRPNGVWDLGGAEEAELAKLAETTYRNLNIAFANELAVYADRIGIDLRAVIDASNSQPYSRIHQPGVAVGGHCIPVYPHFLLSGFPDATLVQAGLDVNAAMPAYAVALLDDLLGGLDGARVAVLGAAYRGGVKETAFSGVFPLVTLLRAAGADVTVHDPLFSDGELDALGLPPLGPGAPCDGAVIQADHAEYRDWAPDRLPGIRGLVDGRGLVDPSAWPGVAVRRIGDGGPSSGDGATR